MAENTKAVAKKTTKKDLEAEIEVLTSERDFSNEQAEIASKQLNDYWTQLTQSQDREYDLARRFFTLEGDNARYRDALRASESATQVAVEIGDELADRVVDLEAQQNFLLHVVHSMTLYEGSNPEVVKSLAESILVEMAEAE